MTSDDVMDGPAPDPDLLLNFLRASDLTALRDMLEVHPILLSEHVEPLLNAWLLNYAGEERITALVEAKRDLLRACRASGPAAVFAALASDAFAALFDAYEEAVSLAALRNDITAWQAAADAGAALLAPDWRAVPGLDHAALCDHVANTLNRLGNAHAAAGDQPAALVAYERAIALQPGFAMSRRNRVSALIELGRGAEAAAELQVARRLEPDAPRLIEMERELAKLTEQTPGTVNG